MSGDQGSRGLILLDRRAERETIDGLLDAARDGLSGTLVLRGEPGIGKTSLLEYAVQQARGMRVARAAGIEPEMALSFAAVHQLLIPFLDRLDRLPAPQLAALRTMFGLEGGAPPNRFLAGLAVLTLLAGDAQERPLLLIIDDAQWLDRESAEVLAFVARRLYADPVACLFAVREPAEHELAERAPPLDGLTSLQLRGLPKAQARELLVLLAGGPLDERVINRVVAETGGNPLALAGVAGELAGGRLASGSLPPGPLPVGSRLEERFLRQVRDLPADTRALLLLAAAEPSGDRGLLWRTAGRLGLDAEAAVPAEASGLAVFEPKVAFRHPLVRSAVYHGAPAGERRRVHGALAAVIDSGLDPDRRAWHRAAAAVGPDEQAAAELERSADRVRERGGYAATAALLARAAELTPHRSRRAERMLAAAQAELSAGVPGRAQELLEEAVPHLVGSLARAQAQGLDGRIRFALGKGGEAPSILLQAARAVRPLDPERAQGTLLEALEAALYAGRTATGAGPAEVARAVAEMTPVPSSQATITDLLLHGYSAVLTGVRAAGVPLLRRVIVALLAREFPVAEGIRWLLLAGRAAGDLMDDTALHALASRAVQLARDAGALTTLPLALSLLGVSEILSGRFTAAEACRAEELQISAATGNPGILGTAPSEDALVLAWRGREAETRAAATALTRQGVEHGRGIAVSMALYALATLELGLGRYEAALGRGLDLCREDPFVYGTLALPGVIEAAARSGDTAAAAAALGRLGERSAASGTPWALGLLARSRALLASDADAEPLYRTAIGHLQSSRAGPDLARAHLLYGEWLRRQRRRRDARARLRAAHEMLEAMGAGAFAARAAAELRATGERARRRMPGTSDALTPQEAQIARLAAAGASNPEIAEQLFISASTVDYHLRKVFRKLGVASRTQLVSTLPGYS
ncbi:MAG TPA: LuxR family transcriptional regulator [Trebonia sp.]|nr:LuxR family transcriptional regulator [Trebonia sp.]